MAVNLDYVEYPSGLSGRRQVHYELPGAAPIAAALGRVGSITDGASATYASYTYLGAGGIVQITHPDVSGGLTLSYGSSGSYDGLDDLGRVVDQHWTNAAGTTTIDRYRYGYDGASSRTHRENAFPSLAAFDELYSHDDLNRLTEARRGDLGDPPTTLSNAVRVEGWGLDQRTTGRCICRCSASRGCGSA